MESYMAVLLAGLAVSMGFAGSAAAQTPSTVSIRLTNALSSASSQPGDTFTGTLAEPLAKDDRIVAHKGVLVTGRVRDAVSSGRMSRPASLTLYLRNVQPRYPVQTGDLTLKADSHATRNVLIIGGSAGAGALIGGVADGGKGAVIGALAGAGAGTLGAFLTGKREILLPAETVLTFHVTSVTISPQELAQLQRVAPYGDAAPRNTRDMDDRRDHRYQGRFPSQVRYITFHPSERTTILSWFGHSRGNLPPGLAKRKHLPPGLAKQLLERGTLPPGLQKRVQPLPWALERELRRLPSGYSRVIISGSIVLLHNRTSVVCDIIRDVIV